jgi:hypothetical protein
MLFIFRFLCLFTFRQHKQLPMIVPFFKGYASLEVTRQRVFATDLTFLTGFINRLETYLSGAAGHLQSAYHYL